MPDSITFNTLISVCEKCGQWRMARQVGCCLPGPFIGALVSRVPFLRNPCCWEALPTACFNALTIYNLTPLSPARHFRCRLGSCQSLQVSGSS